MAPSMEKGSSTAPHLFSSRRRQVLQGPRATVVSAGSTLLVVIVAMVLIWQAPGGQAVREFFFSPHRAWEAFVGNPSKGIAAVGRGFFTNLWMCLVCEISVLVGGLLLATARFSRSPWLTPFRLASIAYTDFFRGIPIILVLLAVGYGLPGMQLGALSSQSPAVYACIALTLTYSAYVAEVYRAGINAVPTNQVVAARSLGLRPGAAMRFVVLPQAVRNVVPPLLNDFISLQKDTALVSVLGIVDASQAAHIYGSLTFNYAGYTVAALLFLAVTIPLTRWTDSLISKDRSRRLAYTS